MLHYTSDTNPASKVAGERKTHLATANIFSNLHPTAKLQNVPNVLRQILEEAGGVCCS
jgi:hypothetical protein